MNHKQLTLLVITLAAFLAKPASAQFSEPTDSLILQLQKLTDSTIFYEARANSSWAANYYILSKKSDTVNAFSYRDLATTNINSGIIRGVFKQMPRLFPFKIMSTKPSMNQFFHYYPIPKDRAFAIWKEMLAVQPWSQGDDAINGAGCPESAMRKKSKDGKTYIEYTNIYDGGSIRIYLITKDEIRVLNYYAPNFYEEHCPGRADRIAALKIEDLFIKNILK